MKRENFCDIRERMWMLYILKVCHDNDIDYVVSSNKGYPLTEDLYWDVMNEALCSVADPVYEEAYLYKKYGIDPDSTYIWVHRNEDMAEYFRYARKLHRLEGKKCSENEYENAIYRKMNGMISFYSYAFDYDIGNKRKVPQLEIITWPEFCEHGALFAWIVNLDKMFKAELPKIKEKYRQARRKKRCAKSIKSGGVLCAA